jgi:hypothetical protein
VGSLFSTVTGLGQMLTNWAGKDSFVGGIGTQMVKAAKLIGGSATFLLYTGDEYEICTTNKNS